MTLLCFHSALLFRLLFLGFLISVTSLEVILHEVSKEATAWMILSTILGILPPHWSHSWEETHSSIDQVFKAYISRNFVTINFNIIFLVSNNSNNFERGLFEVLDFKERMSMINWTFTVLAKIKICAYGTLVSNTFNVNLSTTITVITFMNDSQIFLFFHWLRILGLHLLTTKVWLIANLWFF